MSQKPANRTLKLPSRFARTARPNRNVVSTSPRESRQLCAIATKRTNWKRQSRGSAWTSCVTVSRHSHHGSAGDGVSVAVNRGDDFPRFFFVLRGTSVDFPAVSVQQFRQVSPRGEERRVHFPARSRNFPRNFGGSEMIEQNRGIASDGFPRELGTQIANLAGKSAAKEGNGGKPAQRIIICRQKLPRTSNQQRAGTLISAGITTSKWRERFPRKEGKKRGTFRHGGSKRTHFGELEGKFGIGGKLVLDVTYMKPREKPHSPRKGGKDCRQKARGLFAPLPALFPIFPREAN